MPLVDTHQWGRKSLEKGGDRQQLPRNGGHFFASQQGNCFRSPVEAQGRITLFCSSIRDGCLSQQTLGPSFEKATLASGAPQCPNIRAVMWTVMLVSNGKPGYFSGHASPWCTGHGLCSWASRTLLCCQSKGRSTLLRVLQHCKGWLNAHDQMRPIRSSQKMVVWAVTFTETNLVSPSPTWCRGQQRGFLQQRLWVGVFWQPCFL